MQTEGAAENNLSDASNNREQSFQFLPNTGYSLRFIPAIVVLLTHLVAGPPLFLVLNNLVVEHSLCFQSGRLVLGMRCAAFLSATEGRYPGRKAWSGVCLAQIKTSVLLLHTMCFSKTKGSWATQKPFGKDIQQLTEVQNTV